MVKENEITPRPVPESKWLIKNRPEYDVDCVVCGKPIRYSTTEIPSAHHGRCQYAAEEYPVRIKSRGREKKKSMKDAIEQLISSII